MFVSKRMAQNPVIISPEDSIDAAMTAMRKGRFRRLPVVEEGRLVSFISDRDLMRVAPSPATTLSKYEEKSLLAKLKVTDIMPNKVISISDEATIEEAALLMEQNRIGGLPVISSVGVVVGVITETDIFKTFIDVMGLAKGKTRLTVEVEDKVGVVYELASVFKDAGLSIDSLVTCKQLDGKYEIVIRGNIPDAEDIKSKIEAQGYKVIHSVKIG
jgi:acetoin utilization protein AcuB